MSAWTLARIRDYYREHASVLAGHLAGRAVTCFPPTGEPPAPIASVADLLRRTEAGVGGFAIPPVRLGEGRLDRLVIDLTPGDGADVATAATAALGLRALLADAVTGALGNGLGDGHGDALADALGDGNRDERTGAGTPGPASDPVPVLDGRGGLQLLMACAPADPGAAVEALDDVLREYAVSAPELATTDPAATGGRVLLSADGSSRERASWAPYSLVPGSWPGVVVPVTWDDVAAASAGMPLEVEPEDVADRLELRGDPLQRFRGDLGA